jgi:hypothetical protein
MQKVLSICLGLIISTCAVALPAHPYFITIGGGAGYNDWGPLIGHAYGDTHGRGSRVFYASPMRAGGYDGLFTIGLGFKASRNFKIEADYFYFTPTKVQFKGDNFYYDKLRGLVNPSFTTRTQAADLAMVFSVNLLQKIDLNAYLGAGVGLVHRNDLLADINRFGGSFSAGLTHKFNSRISTELGMNYFTGYDKSEVKAASSFVPFLYGAHLNLTYNFG